MQFLLSWPCRNWLNDPQARVYLCMCEGNDTDFLQCHIHNYFWSGTLWWADDAVHVCIKEREQRLWPNATFQAQKSTSVQLKLSDHIQMKDGKLRLDFLFIIKLDESFNDVKCKMSNSVIFMDIFRCSRCVLRFTSSAYIFLSITAHITVQWDLLCCIIWTQIVKNYNLTSYYEMDFHSQIVFRKSNYFLWVFSGDSILSQRLTSCSWGQRSKLDSEWGIHDRCPTSVLGSSHLC